jgi:N-acetyl-gamma-glutamyl-phosphate reductase
MNYREMNDAEFAAAVKAAPRDTRTLFDAATLSIERCSNTDRIDIFIFANDVGDQVRLVAALDNLGKGASGAAVQSLNLVLGHDETEGLKL